MGLHSIKNYLLNTQKKTKNIIQIKNTKILVRETTAKEFNADIFMRVKDSQTRTNKHYILFNR